MKKITVLGVTGSIGTQTIDVVTGHPDEFEIVAMSEIRRNHESTSCSTYLCTRTERL